VPARVPRAGSCQSAGRARTSRTSRRREASDDTPDHRRHVRPRPVLDTPRGPSCARLGHDGHRGPLRSADVVSPLPRRPRPRPSPSVPVDRAGSLKTRDKASTLPGPPFGGLLVAFWWPSGWPSGGLIGGPWWPGWSALVAVRRDPPDRQGVATTVVSFRGRVEGPCHSQRRRTLPRTAGGSGQWPVTLSASGSPVRAWTMRGRERGAPDQAHAGDQFR
jgi:hypothetical protein